MRHHPRRFALERLEPRDVPAAHFAAVGSDAGVIATAKLVDTTNGQARYSVFPFGTDFTGGVRVATGDVTGDGVPDLIAAPGVGGGPVVKVFDGVTGAEVRSTLVFDGSFRGGLYVAAADTNLDGFAEVVAGAGEGGGPAAAVIDGATGTITSSFFAFGANFRGGVRVAAGDVDGDGRADVVAAAGPGGGPNVKAFSLAGGSPREVASFFAYDAAFAGGVYVAAGDLDGDGLADIATGAGEGGGPLVRVFHADGTAFTSFLAADAGQRSGVRVGVIDAGGNYGLDIATAVPGPADTVTGRFSAAGQALDATGLAGGWVNGGADVAPDAALLWNVEARRAIAADAVPLPVATRILAMTQAAVFDAVNDVVGRYQAYTFSTEVSPNSDPEAAGLLAGEHILSALFPARSDHFVAVRDARLALIPDGDAKTYGAGTGLQAAEIVEGTREFDGSDAAADFPYTPGTAPGNWQPTPPDNAPFLLPGWGDVRPFAIDAAAGYRPAGPPDLTSPGYAAALNEVQQLGSATSTTRTADQTTAARFWDAGTGTETPAGLVSELAEQVIRRSNLDLVDSARVLALVNIAAADATIVTWDTKRAFDWWRPVTAIRNAGTDNNPATTADPTWTPLLATPDSPDYTAEQAAVTAAGAAVLEGLFGTVYHFRLYSPELPGVAREFDGFGKAAAEAGESRIAAGADTRPAVQDGLDSGKAVGEFVVGNKLQPVT